MRVTVDLHHYFTDDRSKAKVYVKANMKYIKDLERRISKIFEINDFHLLCQNHYLSPWEDVKLLNLDEVVCVVPNLPSEQEQLQNAEAMEQSISIETEIQPIKKKKKAKKIREAVAIEETKIAKRKRKCKASTSKNDQIRDKEQRESPVGTKSPTLGKIDDSIFKDSGRDSLDSSKSEELINEGKTVNVKSLVDTFETKKIDFKKQIDLHNSSPFLDTNRRINIVKTIIVQHDSLSDCNTSSNTNTVPSCINILQNINETDPKTEESMIDTPLDSTCSTSRLETTLDNSCNSSLENADIKRQRKRIRKRKRINKVSESTTTLKNPLYDLIPRPLLTQVKNPRHVRFNDDLNQQESGTQAVIDNSTAKPEDLEEKELVSEKVSVDEPKERLVPEKAIEKELTEEFILKQPVMQNMQPRQGDIVAFKILRMSETYTPEISSRIVGKISCYNSPNSEVVFDIIYGQDQCILPQGKFSVVAEEELTNSSNHYNCKWSDLLEPRLLYP